MLTPEESGLNTFALDLPCFVTETKKIVIEFVEAYVKL